MKSYFMGILLSIGKLFELNLYDFSTATKLLEVCKMLKERYGTITALLDQSRSRKDPGKRLLEFKGVRPKTVEIFMRDLKKV